MENFEQELREVQLQLEKIQQQQQQQQLFKQQSEQQFQLNLATLKHYYPEIHQQVMDYQPREDFSILVSESGHGNFVPAKVKVPIYSQMDPMAQVRAQVEENRAKPIFGRAALYKERKSSNDKRIHIRFMNELSSKIAELTAESQEPKIKALPTHFPSFLSFGIGLGYHIPLLLEQHSFDYIFLCEPDFELFYASLFCLDWRAVFEKVEAQNSSLYLLIGISYQDFLQKVIDLTAVVGAFSIINSFCYQHYPSAELNKSIEHLFRNFYQVQLGFGFYNDALNGLSHAVRNSRQGAQFFLKNPSLKPHKGVPAFVVGNGPSLDDCIELIREYQDKAVIFASGTALQSLLNAGVVPDFHVIVERTLSVYQVLADTTTEDMLKNMNLLSVEVVYPETLKHYKWAGLGLKGPEASTAFFQMLHYLKTRQVLSVLPFAGPLVSNTSAAYACELGFEEIYLFGVDNGYPMDKSKSHSSLSIYSNDKYSGRYSANPNAIYPLEGNLDGAVLATDFMAISKQQLDNLFLSHPEINAYKVGDGARLRGVTPLHVDDVIISSRCKDKPALIERIKADFFHPLEVSAMDEKLLAFEEYDRLISYLIEIGERPIHSRKEASDILKAQARVVYTYKETLSAHLFHVVKGTLLYFHCPLITLLYTYEDEEQTLKWFEQCFAIWMRFLTEIKSDFPQNWYNPCEFELWVPPSAGQVKHS